jgi:hypothetical protein
VSLIKRRSMFAPGLVLGASEIIFDLSSQENDSVRLIVEILVLLVISLYSMSWVLYMVIKKGLIEGKTIVDDEETS